VVLVLEAARRRLQRPLPRFPPQSQAPVARRVVSTYGGSGCCAGRAPAPAGPVEVRVPDIGDFKDVR
jgi:hypothetical protein